MERQFIAYLLIALLIVGIPMALTLARHKSPNQRKRRQAARERQRHRERGA